VISRRSVGRVAAILLAATAAVWACDAPAQDATVTASVLVVPEGYEVVGTDDLDFGALVPGVLSTVDPEDAAAGRWEAGDFPGGGANSAHDVVLKIYLSDLSNGTGGIIRPNWDGDFALVRSLTPGVTSYRRWNPTQTLVIEVGAGSGQSGQHQGEYGARIEVFIGGEIPEAEIADAPGGTYTGDLLLTVVPDA
jgi:hypothetical protein